LPLYVQIVNAVRDALLAGAPEEDYVLPPQRELAEQLGVSRNTVGMAYAELERQGLVVSQVGRGTVWVDSAGRMESRSRRQALTRAIEYCTEQALTLGFNLDEYADIFDSYLREKKRVLDHIRLVFVECNREQLTYFADHLRLGPRVVTVPLLLDDIREKPDMMAPLLSADIVVTSFYHMDELSRLLEGSDTPLVGVNLQPEMSTIVSIARIADDARIGLVGSSTQFLAEIGKTLKQMGVAMSRISQCTATDSAHLAAFVSGCDALVVSPSRRREVEALADGRQVVEFLFSPDDTSVRHIRIALVELKQRKEDGIANAHADGRTDVP